jgi:lysophospholipase L1-like esterase
VSLRTRPLVGLLVVALAAALTACGGGGFSSSPPPPPDKALHRYVALGDGFTAAPYAGKTQGEDGCLRSADNYPALVAADLGIDRVKDVSCTGATTDAFKNEFEPGTGKAAVPPQIEAITAKTDLVTIGMGIEDGELLHDMFVICAAQPCAPRTAFYTKVLAAVDKAGEQFTDVLRQIQAKAPNAFIVVVGYPMITPPPDSACDAYPEQPTLPEGIDPVTYLIEDLNRELQTAARQTGSGFVDVATLSADHQLCSEQPWVHDMRSRPGKAVAYHPVAAEQRAVAEEVAAQVRAR